MRRYFLLSVTVCVYLAAMVFGIVKRQTYTNITASENYLWQLQVAEFPEELAERACAVMERELPAAPPYPEGGGYRRDREYRP